MRPTGCQRTANLNCLRPQPRCWEWSPGLYYPSTDSSVSLHVKLVFNVFILELNTHVNTCTHFGCPHGEYVIGGGVNARNQCRHYTARSRRIRVVDRPKGPNPRGGSKKGTAEPARLMTALSARPGSLNIIFARAESFYGAAKKRRFCVDQNLNLVLGPRWRPVIGGDTDHSKAIRPQPAAPWHLH